MARNIMVTLNTWKILIWNNTTFFIYLNILQICDDPACQRHFQETLNALSLRWGRDPGLIPEAYFPLPLKCSIIICSERHSKTLQMKFSTENEKDTKTPLQTKASCSVWKYPSALKIKVYISTNPVPSKGIQWTGLHTTQVPTERYLQIDNSVFIISTLLCRLNISLGCLNSPSSICYYVYIWLCLSLFKVISCLSSTIANFLFRHNMHHFAVVLYNWCVPAISHNIITFLFCSFSIHVSLESTVSVLYFLFLKDFHWFVYCDLNLVSLMP